MADEAVGSDGRSPAAGRTAQDALLWADNGSGAAIAVVTNGTFPSVGQTAATGSATGTKTRGDPPTV